MGNIIAIFDNTFLVFHNAIKPPGFTEQYLCFLSQTLVIKVFRTPYTYFWYEPLRNGQLTSVKNSIFYFKSKSVLDTNYGRQHRY